MSGEPPWRVRGMTIQCPYCRAAPGERCRTSQGAPAYFNHSIRVDIERGASLGVYHVAGSPCRGCGEPPRHYGGRVVQPHQPGCPGNRPRDVNVLAAAIVAAATGGDRKPSEPHEGKNPAAVELGRRGGLRGGPARAAKLTPERRSEIARTAAAARWRSLHEEEERRRRPLAQRNTRAREQ
jgi:hypothetical protein